MVVYAYSYLYLSNGEDHPCIGHAREKVPVKREPCLGGSWDVGKEIKEHSGQCSY